MTAGGVRTRRTLAAAVAFALLVAAVVGAGALLWPRPAESAVLQTGTTRHLVTVTVDPPRRGAADLDVELADRSGTPVPASAVRIDAVMPLMGHAHPTVTAQRTGAGRFRVAGMHLMAAGPWQLRVTVEPADGAVDTVTVPLDVTG